MFEASKSISARLKQIAIPKYRDQKTGGDLLAIDPDLSGENSEGHAAIKEELTINNWMAPCFAGAYSKIAHFRAN
jgi:hypothetical protein